MVLFSQSNKEEKFEIREAVYSDHRAELHTQLMKSNKEIKSACVGFFKDPRHLANQFSYLTSAPPLNEKVEKNLHKQLDMMYQVLKYKNKTVQFETTMKEVEVRCLTDFNSSRTLKDIHVLRQACIILDAGNETAFIKLDEDEEVEDPSPHLRARQIDKSFVFEVWVERSELLGKMDIASAISAFLHLCFVLNLQYPKGMCVLNVLKIEENLTRRTVSGRSFTAWCSPVWGQYR